MLLELWAPAALRTQLETVAQQEPQGKKKQKKEKKEVEEWADNLLCPYCPQEGLERFFGTDKANLNSHLMSVHGMDAHGNKKVVKCRKCGRAAVSGAPTTSVHDMRRSAMC